MYDFLARSRKRRDEPLPSRGTRASAGAVSSRETRRKLSEASEADRRAIDRRASPGRRCSVSAGMGETLAVRERAVLVIIGELCFFMEFAGIVTALSSKLVILPVPDQVRRAARASRVGRRLGCGRSKKVVGNMRSSPLARHANATRTPGAGRAPRQTKAQTQKRFAYSGAPKRAGRPPACKLGGPASRAVQSQQVSGYPDRLISWLSENTT